MPQRPTALSSRSLLARLGRMLALALPLTAAALVAAPVQAEEPIRLGDLNSYTKFPAFTIPYRQGWQLALTEINAAGGVLDRPLEVISRDDGAATGDAVRVAEELVAGEEVALLFGTMLSNTGLAVADYARQRQVFFLAAEPLTDALTMDKGNRYTFRMRPSTHMQTAMLVQEAKQLGVQDWAIVAPNYEYGQAAAESFKRLTAREMPEATIKGAQFPALGKIDAGATVQALAALEAPGLFNVLFGGDLAKFVREGSLRGLFKDKVVISLLTGEPEWLDPLKEEAPEGWLVTGYPWQEIDTPAHNTFRDAYEQAYQDYPRMGSVVGYASLHAIALAIEKAGSTDTDALIAAMEDLTFDTPFGPVLMRGLDHQATMGTFVGRLTVKDGGGRMYDWTYADGADYMFTEEEVKAARPE